MARQLDQATIDEILRLHSQGLTNSEIGAAVGVHANSVASQLRWAGLPYNEPRDDGGAPNSPLITVGKAAAVDAKMRQALGDLGYPDVGETPEEAGERARQLRRRAAMARFREDCSSSKVLDAKRVRSFD